MRMKDKVAVVTGAASGMGKHVAIRFAREGAKLIIADINEDGLNKTEKMIKEYTDNIIKVILDVRSEDAWASLTEVSVSQFGRIDVLYNSAGILIAKPLVETTIEDWDRLMDINAKSIFLGMKHIVPVMAKNGSGSVINTSSDAGLEGTLSCAAYGASKGAVRALTKHAAAEYVKDGVRINSIHPGYVDTEMVADVSKEELHSYSPMGRSGTVEDIAHLLVYLASDESSFVTASEFVIDGGGVNMHG